MKTDDARLKALQFSSQHFGATRHFSATEISRIRTRAFNQVGEADAKLQQQSVVDRFQSLHAKRLPRAQAEARA